MGQSTVIATAFTAIMFVAGVSILLMTSVSSFDTLAGVISDQSQQNDVFLHERVEFGFWTLDGSNILRVNITNTGDTTIMLNDIKNADLLVSLNNGSETTRWVGLDPTQKGWLASWDQRVKLTIDSNDIESGLSEFPVLIYLSTSSGRNSDDVSFVFDELQNDANRLKIAITTSDGVSQCYVEVEEWDDANEEAWLWIKAPSINSASDTDLYLYYDASHADNTAYVGDPNSSPAEAVWGNEFRLVTHMRDDPDTSHIRDSTDFDNDGTKVAAGEPVVTTSGNVSDAQDFDGSNDYVDLGSDASLDLRSSNFTVEAWIYPTTQTTRWPTIYAVGTWEISLGIGQDSNTDKLEVWVDDATAYASDSDVTYDAWNYVVLSWNGSRYNFFIDGVADGSRSGSAYPDTGTTYIGGISGEGQSYLSGIIDEVRTSNTSRTSSWVKASYESGKDDLVDFGSEELTSDQNGSSTDYWLINRVFFRGSEGDLMNPMELSDPVHGGWDPLETIEVFVNLVEVDPTFKYLTFVTPNGVQAHSSLSVDLDYGRATIAAGKSTVTVSHDLGRIPVNIQLTAGGAINQEFWARDWTDTTFVIEVENNQPDDIVFFWQVR